LVEVSNARSEITLAENFRDGKGTARGAERLKRWSGTIKREFREQYAVKGRKRKETCWSLRGIHLRASSKKSRKAS